MFSLPKRVYTTLRPPVETKDTAPVRFGILGAANIAPPALINPAKSHPEVVIAAVAARDKTKAEKFAKQNGIEKVYHGPTGYQDMLNDTSIDAIYNPLPNALHYEWTMKALEAGKHVLLEKPSADRAEEMKNMAELAKKKNLVLLEAWHVLFHPALQRLKAIVDSKELGSLKSINANLEVPKGFVKDGDIRLNYELGGGVMMDMGVYPLIISRYLCSSEPTVVSATATPYQKDPAIDRRMEVKMSFPSSVDAEIVADLSNPPIGPLGLIPRMPFCSITAHCQDGSVQLYNFGAPSFYHYIKVTKNKGSKGVVKERTETAFKFENDKGEDWWTTYRYQLEAFVNQVKGRKPQAWVSNEYSVAQMEVVESIYTKAGLELRPASTYKSPAL